MIFNALMLSLLLLFLVFAFLFFLFFFLGRSFLLVDYALAVGLVDEHLDLLVAVESELGCLFAMPD